MLAQSVNHVTLDNLTFDKGGKRGGADELFVTGNFKESVETVMKGTICF